MAFTVRTSPTGAGNSLGAVADADAYFSDRGIVAWTGNSTVKQGGLIRATDYIDGRFSLRYTDEVLDGTYDGEFVPGTTIPVKLARASYEYALRALTAQLAPDPTMDASGVAVVNTRKKLGPLEKEFQVLGSKVPLMFRPYPAADMLLIGLLKPIANRVIR